MVCKLEAEVPSLSLPNWLALVSGVPPEVHGLLGNRAPPEPAFSSLVGVARELGIENVLIGSPWFVDLFRSQVTPLAGDGSCSASYEEFEALGPDAAANDLRREEALLAAVNGTSRLIIAQLSAINSAGHLNEQTYVAKFMNREARRIVELALETASPSQAGSTERLSRRGSEG